MKNEQLFNELKESKFSVNGLILNKEIRPEYNVFVEFNEDTNIIVVANFYYNEKAKFDWPKRNVVFIGRCESLEKFAELIQILNVEDEAKIDILSSLVDVSVSGEKKCNCGCGCK